MRIHTDLLSFTQINGALTTAGFGNEVWLETCTEHKSRKRRYAYEVSLSAEPGRDRNGKARRPKNSGHYGASGAEQRAATYDEWGYWIAVLMDLDPRLVFGPYNGREDFHAQTRGKYQRVQA